MSTLTVLCPNGRRQQVKVQPNTKLLEVLEEVCKKQGFSPNEHDLIHHKRPVDLTLPFRLSGVPNNAQLDLKKNENGASSRRGGEQVVISLQLDDGSRLEPTQFKSDNTLFELVQTFAQKLTSLNEKLESKDENGFPCVSYLNDEIIGLYQIKNTTLKDLGLTSGRSIVRFSVRKIDTTLLNQLDNEFKAKLEKKQKLDEIFESKRREQELEEARAKSQVESLSEERPKPAPLAETKPQEQRAPKQEEKKPKLEFMDYDIVNRSETSSQTRGSNPEFLNFKFPEETKGQDLNNVNELAEIERESKRPCDRQACLIQPVTKDTATSQEATASTGHEVEDEFYEVTRDDLVNMLKDLRKAQSDEGMLMTRQMRELEQDRKAMRYSQIVIRVAFNDGLVLQGFFRPKEPVSALYSFVRDSIDASGDHTDFHLFVTPPRVVLPDDTKSTLFDFKLYPAALVHFKGSKPIKFKPTLSDNLKNMNEADELVHENVHKQIRNVNDEGMRWLQKEQSQQAQNIARVSGLIQSNASRSENYQATTSSSDQPRSSASKSDEKLLRFLKGSKK